MIYLILNGLRVKVLSFWSFSRAVVCFTRINHFDSMTLNEALLKNWQRQYNYNNDNNSNNSYKKDLY